jgi:hypothetical protein
MQTRGMLPVAWWIVGSATVAVGMLTALAQAKWGGPALVGAGTLVYAGFLIWRWRIHQLVDGVIEDYRWVHLARLVFAVVGEAMVTVIFWLYLMTPGPSPCWCANAHRFHTWFELVVGGFGVLWMEIFGVYWIVIMVYRAFHGRWT